MLEGRARDRGADRGIGKRIDRGVGIAGLARAGQLGADVGGQGRGEARLIRTSRLRRGPLPRWLPAAKLSATWPTRLATTWLPPCIATSK